MAQGKTLSNSSVCVPISGLTCAMLRLPKYAADWPRSRAENMLMVMALYESELQEANRQLALCGETILDFKDACSSLQEQRYSIIREETFELVDVSTCLVRDPPFADHRIRSGSTPTASCRNWQSW
uniref:Uncharacterized protein n=1 Tax=Noctiluca scintillans TaxID=2966 RepID=A0A7S1A159_NOCSC